MNPKAVLFGVLGAGCAVMLAGAMTTGRREIVPRASTGRSAVDLQGAALGAEIAKLRARLRPTVEPREPSRNLFEFGTSGVVSRSTPQAASSRPADVVPAAEVIAPPSMRLVGLAEDAGADGPVRTAFISGLGDLFLAKEGDVLGARYQVDQISGTGVTLTDLIEHATIQLPLK